MERSDPRTAIDIIDRLIIRFNEVVSDEVSLHADIDAGGFALKIYETAKIPESGIRLRKGFITGSGLITVMFDCFFIVFMKEIR